MRLEGDETDKLRQIASYLAHSRAGDTKNLTRRLVAAASVGEVKDGEFTVADVNIIVGEINKQDFLAKVFGDIAKEPRTPATSGADREATEARAKADRLREYEALVQRLVR
jgi:hypothetical protein